MFKTDYTSILAQIEAIDPVKYARTRNFENGAVTRLSPHLSRGVISTSMILESLQNRGFQWHEVEKLVQELAWRDYYQNVWTAKGNELFEDIKNAQFPVNNNAISEAIINATTGISAIDTGINTLYKTGYMHNHLRMYTSAIACNVAMSHWKMPARWLYYHLLDADVASNTLSWQWVAGTFSSKKYVANQENINKYFNTKDRNTFLDIDYADFDHIKSPEILKATTLPELKTILPTTNIPTLNPDKETAIYNFYNLDPQWLDAEDVNRVLLLEPTHFEQFPISEKVLDFAFALSKNIPDIQIVSLNFKDLQTKFPTQKFHYKTHPTTSHYKGTAHAAEFMNNSVKGYFPSFFGYWKKAEVAISKQF